jgi:peptidase E
MKLYLSSYRIPTKWEFGEVLGQDFEQTNVAIIPNAKDYREDKDEKLAKLVEDLGEFGLKKTSFLDLNKFEEPDQLREDIKGYDMLYVAGGNVLDLLFAMKVIDFPRIVREFLDNGGTYVGESAGAVVAGPSTKGFSGPDDPPHVTKHYEYGLGLIDKVVIPHADSADYGPRTPELVAIHGANALLLDNNQAFVMNNDAGRVVTGETV